MGEGVSCKKFIICGGKSLAVWYTELEGVPQGGNTSSQVVAGSTKRAMRSRTSARTGGEGGDDQLASRKSSPWNEFLASHGGKGKSRQELSKMWKRLQRVQEEEEGGSPLPVLEKARPPEPGEEMQEDDDEDEDEENEEDEGDEEEDEEVCPGCKVMSAELDRLHGSEMTRRTWHKKVTAEYWRYLHLMSARELVRAHRNFTRPLSHSNGI